MVYHEQQKTCRILQLSILGLRDKGSGYPMFDSRLQKLLFFSFAGCSIEKTTDGLKY